MTARKETWILVRRTCKSGAASGDRAGFTDPRQLRSAFGAGSFDAGVESLLVVLVVELLSVAGADMLVPELTVAGVDVTGAGIAAVLSAGATTGA